MVATCGLYFTGQACSVPSISVMTTHFAQAEVHSGRYTFGTLVELSIEGKKSAMGLHQNCPRLLLCVNMYPKTVKLLCSVSAGRPP
ncbi:hypothetical protein GDO78_020004 [Eleutherodactylus coqui]|uniref:Uncharacterized protein n=1 Tax=Eleutherodactylus coqui TaxID=57060 RepID=A0A8J6EAJ4_ELECQ|nr:hypothetical protein GDO78_020004 [Eleutherodactylus coqui]